MTKEELLVYELPSITEYVSWSPLQKIIARYTVWKVDTKVKRLNKRQDRVRFLNSFLK